MAEVEYSVSLVSSELQINARKVVVLFGLWLFAMMWFNDMTNYGSFKLGIHIRLDRVVFVCLLIAFANEQTRQRLPWNSEERLMALLVFLSLASCIVFGSIGAPNNRYLAQISNFTVLPAILFAVARRISFDIHESKTLQSFFKAIGVYLALMAICEHYGWDSLVFPKYILDPSVGLHFGRARGPFGDAVAMGGALTIIFFWVLWEQMYVERSKLNGVLLAALPAAIYFTDTRSVWLFFVTTLGVLALLSKQLRKPCCYVVAALAVIYVSGVASKFSAYQPTLFSRRQGPIDDRKNILHASFKMFLARPIFGFGYGNYLRYSPDFFTEIEGVPLRGEGEGQHNTLLGLLAETGMVGTIPYCVMVALFIRTCVRGLGGSASDGPMGHSIATTQFALLCGLTVYMQFSDIRFYTFVNCLMFWMAGVTNSILSPDTQHPIEPRSHPGVLQEALS